MNNAIPANLAAITERIKQAALSAGRDPASVRLVAVSKSQPQESTRAALAAGHRLFGENRVQEAAAKFPDLRADWPDIELHLIGPLQTNKAEEATLIFDVIETLDRPHLAEALSKAMRKTGRSIPCYVEINSGNEPQKTGLQPHQLGEFLRLCREDYGLTVTGLMCIPPQSDDPEPHFQRLRQLAESRHLPHISMGMSADFESAIRAGATEIRIGTAIFGGRERP
jgi:pyridoxal phosphate enzyme (YggS family)